MWVEGLRGLQKLWGGRTSHNPPQLQKFREKLWGDLGGLAALEALPASMTTLETKKKKLDGEGVRVMRAVLRRPRVAARLVSLDLG